MARRQPEDAALGAGVAVPVGDRDPAGSGPLGRAPVRGRGRDEFPVPPSSPGDPAIGIANHTVTVPSVVAPLALVMSAVGIREFAAAVDAVMGEFALVPVAAQSRVDASAVLVAVDEIALVPPAQVCTPRPVRAPSTYSPS